MGRVTRRTASPSVESGVSLEYAWGKYNALRARNDPCGGGAGAKGQIAIAPLARNRKFESISLQRRVCCELDSLDLDEFRGAHGWPGSAMAIALRACFIALALDGPLPSWFLSSAKIAPFSAASKCGAAIPNSKSASRQCASSLRSSSKISMWLSSYDVATGCPLRPHRMSVTPPPVEPAEQLFGPEPQEREFVGALC